MQVRQLQLDRFVPVLLIITLCIGVSNAPAQVSFDWLTVGDVGNAPDSLVMSKGGAPDNTTGYGSVGYEYRIAETHVTNAQWADFLNAVDADATDTTGLWNPNMTNSTIGTDGRAYTGGIGHDFFAPSGEKYWAKSGQENYPATWIHWNSGARFVNWLHNGQGNGDTENGVYDMSVTTVEVPPRQSDASYFIPSEDEFYKAAYYDPTKDGVGGYWEYGTQSDSPVTSAGPPGDSQTGNVRGEDDVYWQTGAFGGGFSFDDSVDYLTDVGAYPDATSHYGLSDADGLVYQWTEGLKLSCCGDQLPVYRGGSWFYNSEHNGAGHRALYSFRGAPSYAFYGLRIASPAAAGGSGDFNNDGNYDCADIDALVAEIASSGTDSSFDLTGDGAVDTADLDAWLVEGGANNSAVTGGNAFLDGDANLDGVVDVSDFNVWNSNKFSTTPEWCSGDFNADGSVDVSDFNIWNSNKFSSAMDVASVPEPGAAILSIIGMLAVVLKSRRHRGSR